MMSFFRQNWVATTALLVALFGGVPGVLSIINQRKNRQIFTFHEKSVLFGTVVGEEVESASIFIIGTASNKGKEPLTPDGFGLRVKYKGTWIPFQARLIFKGFNLESTDYDFEVDAFYEDDLQKFSGIISTAEPVRGFLWFTSSEISQKELLEDKSLKFQITCFDIYGKKHEITFRPSAKSFKGTRQYVKHGFKATPLKN